MEYEDRRLTVVEMDARRIAKIRVEPVRADPPGIGIASPETRFGIPFPRVHLSLTWRLRTNRPRWTKMELDESRRQEEKTFDAYRN